MQFLNKVFNYYGDCVNKLSVYSRMQGNVLSPDEEQLIIAKKDALSYMLAFILSAEDRSYPYMKEGFRDSLSPRMKEYFLIYRSKYAKGNHITALFQAASESRISMAQLKSILNIIDREIKQLTKDQFLDIVRAERVLEVNIAMNFFWQKVARYKVPAHIAG
ncbi:MULTISPECIES: hypothetical protein [Paenibacillus]|uniref:hypothetical protein n=1 Tax=Paenibacillus TaxID=44249 RepID=UPI0011AA5010|nr:hypothetical protein [Paenibacillus sp. IHBB 10380]